MRPATPRPHVRWLTVVVFVVLTVAGGSAIGILNGPDAWYRALEKPAFNPPNWVFAPVWTTLYILIGVAGARCWNALPRSRTAMGLWFLQLALNYAWTPVFFGLHNLGAALAVIAILFLSILAFIGVNLRRDPVAAILFVPYAVWVAFASLLNASIATLNPAT